MRSGPEHDRSEFPDSVAGVVEKARRVVGPHASSQRLAAAARAANRALDLQTGECAAMVYFRHLFADGPQAGMPLDFRAPAWPSSRSRNEPVARRQTTRGEGAAPGVAGVRAASCTELPREIWRRVVVFLSGCSVAAMAVRCTHENEIYRPDGPVVGDESDCGSLCWGPDLVAACDAAACDLGVLAQLNRSMRRMAGDPALWKALSQLRWRGLTDSSTLAQVAPAMVGVATWRRRAIAERELSCPKCNFGRCGPVLYGFPSLQLLSMAAFGFCSFGSDQMQENMGFKQWRCGRCEFASIEYPWR